jgi:hypothetical protein
MVEEVKLKELAKQRSQAGVHLVIVRANNCTPRFSSVILHISFEVRMVLSGSCCTLTRLTFGKRQLSTTCALQEVISARLTL